MNFKEAYAYLQEQISEKRIMRRDGWNEDTFIGLQKERGIHVLVIARTFDNVSYNAWKWMPSYEDIHATDWNTSVYTPLPEVW